MNGVEMTRLLSEMQRLASVADARPSEATTETRGFAELLRGSIDAVANAQNKASDMAAALERGDKSVTLPEVMVAMQKASLSFQAMTEVRNRLVSAYQDIMNMPI
jgi:flagellar hook-basal body complex protein FliE